MAHELIITSVRKGLDGGSGYQPVLRTRDMSQAVAERLQIRCGYSHPYPHGDPRNPIVYIHRIERVAGETLHLLARICDAGSDHTGRSNFLAHLVSAPDGETRRSPAGPADVARNLAFTTSWSGPPRESDPITLIGMDRSPGPCAAWRAAGLDPGIAGDLAETAAKNGDVRLIVRVNDDVLALFADALSLVPPAKRWRVTFNTCEIEPFDASWRAVREDLPQAKAIRGTPRVIDLTVPGVTGGDHGYARFARGQEAQLPWQISAPQNPHIHAAAHETATSRSPVAAASAERAANTSHQPRPPGMAARHGQLPPQLPPHHPPSRRNLLDEIETDLKAATAQRPAQKRGILSDSATLLKLCISLVAILLITCGCLLIMILTPASRPEQPSTAPQSEPSITQTHSSIKSESVDDKPPTTPISTQQQDEPEVTAVNNYQNDADQLAAKNTHNAEDPSPDSDKQQQQIADAYESLKQFKKWIPEDKLLRTAITKSLPPIGKICLGKVKNLTLVSGNLDFSLAAAGNLHDSLIIEGPNFDQKTKKTKWCIKHKNKKIDKDDYVLVPLATLELDNTNGEIIFHPDEGNDLNNDDLRPLRQSLLLIRIKDSPEPLTQIQFVPPQPPGKPAHFPRVKEAEEKIDLQYPKDFSFSADDPLTVKCYARTSQKTFSLTEKNKSEIINVATLVPTVAPRPSQVKKEIEFTVAFDKTTKQITANFSNLDKTNLMSHYKGDEDRKILEEIVAKNVKVIVECEHGDLHQPNNKSLDNVKDAVEKLKECYADYGEFIRSRTKVTEGQNQAKTMWGELFKVDAAKALDYRNRDAWKTFRDNVRDWRNNWRERFYEAEAQNKKVYDHINMFSEDIDVEQVTLEVTDTTDQKRKYDIILIDKSIGTKVNRTSSSKRNQQQPPRK